MIVTYKYYVGQSPWHSIFSGCGWTRQPPGMEGSCEYIK